MIKQGDKIINPRTGQKMFFLKTGNETNGRLLEIECFNPKSDELEPIHIHPYQESSNEVLSGKLHFWIDGKESVIGPGERIVIPAGIPHRFWNEDNEEAHHIARFTPALNIADFFETFFRMSREGKLNKNGVPGFLYLGVFGLAFKDVIRLTKPPWAVQYLTYQVLAPVGKLFGKSLQ